MNAALAGRAVLVTRPAGVADRLAAMLREQGCDPVMLPAIEIRPPEDLSALAKIIERLDEFDLAIFISPTAVREGDAAVRARRAWPGRLRYAAIGGETARALRAIGANEVFAPAGRGDGDALAAMPQLADIAGRQIVVFRGQGGRESLGDALRARGARIEYAQCYRRARPHTPPHSLIERWQNGAIDAVSITSAEGLENLMAMLEAADPAGPALLRATPVFVPHPRVGEAAHARGMERVLVTAAGDHALVEALSLFFAKV